MKFRYLALATVAFFSFFLFTAPGFCAAGDGKVTVNRGQIFTLDI